MCKIKSFLFFVKPILVHFLGCLKTLDLLGTGCCGFKLFVAYVANIINYTYVLLCFYSSPYFGTMVYFHTEFIVIPYTKVRVDTPISTFSHATECHSVT